MTTKITKRGPGGCEGGGGVVCEGIWDGKGGEGWIREEKKAWSKKLKIETFCSQWLAMLQCFPAEEGGGGREQG